MYKTAYKLMQVLSDDAPLTVENIYDKVDGMSLRPFTELRKSCVKRV